MQTNSPHPIFREYRVSDLAELTGYSESYLVNIKDGARARPMFRDKISRILRRPQSELFADDGHEGA